MILLFRLSIPLYQPTFGKYRVLYNSLYNIYLGIAAQYNNKRQFNF